jgi:hypothetical protein
MRRLINNSLMRRKRVDIILYEKLRPRHALGRNRSSIDFVRILRDSQTTQAQAPITEIKARIDYDDVMIV